MKTRVHVKAPAKTATVPAAARMPQPPAVDSERTDANPGVAAQLEGAARLGHSLGAVSVDGSAPPIIQRQELPEEEEEELQMKREPAAIQRQELPEEEEEELQLKAETAALRRQGWPEEEEEVMMPPDIPRVGLQGGPVAPDVEAAIQRATGGGASEVRHENRIGLPDNLKAGLEDLSGLAMDDVRVHYNSSKPAEINAHAFTQGKDIHIASGQEKHLPHEGWHMVQQAQGRVRPTMQLIDGVPVNDDQELEHEADVMGAKALQMRRADQATFAPIAQATALEAQDRGVTQASEVPGAASGAFGGTRRLNFLSVDDAERSAAEASLHAPMAGVSSSPAAALAMQRLIDNRGTARLLQRKLHNSLQGEDAKMRLQYLLSKRGKTRFSPLDMSIYEQIVSSETVYDWDRIRQEFGGQFTQNLGDYERTGTRQVTLYRADGRSPGQLKGANPPGFGVRISLPFGLLKAALLKDVGAFVEDQVRQNRQDLKAYSTDQDCGGYATPDRYLYEIDLGGWHEFTRPSVPGKLSSAIVLANKENISDATMIAIDTQKPTRELFLLFEITLNHITRVRVPHAATLNLIDWGEVVAERR